VKWTPSDAYILRLLLLVCEVKQLIVEGSFLMFGWFLIIVLYIHVWRG
jgi:hypothetical protein